jgi:hypothetical protein
MRTEAAIASDRRADGSVRARACPSSVRSMCGTDDNRDDNDDHRWRPLAPGRHLPRWDAFRELGDCPA